MPIIPITCKEDSENNPKDEWFFPHTEYKRPKEMIKMLPEKYSFDIDRMRDHIKKLEETVGFKPFAVSKDGKKKRTQYQAIGLTHRLGAENPIYDGLNLFAGEDKTQEASDYFSREGNHILYEDHFTEKNELWTGYLGEVLDRFSCSTTKVRLLNLKPRGILPSHIDCPHSEQIKVHAYITSNDNVWININGERFQIPSDGNFYWIDVGRWHSVWNDGDTDRIDLCVNLKVYVDREGNQLLDPSIDILDVIEKGML